MRGTRAGKEFGPASLKSFRPFLETGSPQTGPTAMLCRSLRTEPRASQKSVRTMSAHLRGLLVRRLPQHWEGGNCAHGALARSGLTLFNRASATVAGLFGPMRVLVPRRTPTVSGTQRLSPKAGRESNLGVFHPSSRLPSHANKRLRGASPAERAGTQLERTVLRTTRRMSGPGAGAGEPRTRWSW